MALLGYSFPPPTEMTWSPSSLSAQKLCTCYILVTRKEGLTAPICLLSSPDGGLWRQGPLAPTPVPGTSKDFAHGCWEREALWQQDEGAGNKQVSGNKCSTEKELGHHEVRSHGLSSGCLLHRHHKVVPSGWNKTCNASETWVRLRRNLI